MIEVVGISKTFAPSRRERVEAVRDVTFTCAPGEVFGLIGGNGAGKTTLLRMISTALDPTSGSVAVLGADSVREARKVRRNLAVLSATTGLYPRLTPREVWAYFGTLYGMPSDAIRDRIAELSEMFACEEFLDRMCDHLSGGTRQKVNIARAIFHRPDVLLLDEPTTGLDVVSARRVVNFVRSYKASGGTILYCTHNMAEVEQLCDVVGVMNHGTLAFCGNLDALRHVSGSTLEESVVSLCGETQM